MATYAVLYTYDERSIERDALRPAHRAFLGELHAAGDLLLVGPFQDAPLGALLIVEADSADAALAKVDADPFHLAGLIAERVARPWTQVYGPF